MFDMDTTILPTSKTEPMKSDTPDTQTLLKEFETVFDYVSPGTLTPPQSPPYVQQPLLTTLEPMSTQTPAYILQPKEEPTYQISEKLVSNIIFTPQSPESLHTEYSVPSTPQSNIAHELAVVEELVRARAQDMVQWSNPPSPSCSTSNSGSNFDDSSSEDPEWVPEPVEELAFPQKKSKRFKPYSRVPPEDKKSRKKEQNKNAATRYRLKKKAEVEEILNEERSIQKDNDELENKVNDLQREVRYLKGLMRDLFKAKGLIN